MFCSTDCLVERCHLLYIFITAAIILLLICIYLYKKHTSRIRDENIKIENKEKLNNNPIKISFEELPEILESAEGHPELIRNSLEKNEIIEKGKETDKVIDNAVIIETVDEWNGEVVETTINE